jgi:hypothetical protein
MSNHHDLREAVRNGPPGQLFDLGEHLARFLASRIQEVGKLGTISGPELARAIHGWSEEERP